MNAVRSFMFERIQKTDDVFLARMVGVRLNDLLQQLDLVDCRLRVVSGGPDDFERDMSAGDGVSR